jgi:hypothetical protein
VDATHRREIVASFRAYEQAQEAVDLLSDKGFPVEGLAIEGRGVRLVERVTGRVTYGSAALQGAMTGGVIGLFLGLLFGLLNWFAPTESIVMLALWSTLVGAFWGLVLGLLGHWMTQGRRDFASVGGLVADSYDVTADADIAEEARRMLGTGATIRRTA